MSKRPDRHFLADVQEAVLRTKAYTENLSREQFLQDEKTQDAVIRNLEIVGEAAKNISEKLKHKYPQIPWKDLAGLRDKLIHHYFGVNLDIVWTIVEQELPHVLSQLEDIAKTE